MLLEQGPVSLGQIGVEVVGDFSSGVPASHGYLRACLRIRLRGQAGDEHHPYAPQPLLGGGQADLLNVRDLRQCQALTVVQDHGGPVDQRQPEQGIAQFMARFRTLGYRCRVDRVRVVTPQQIDPLRVLRGHIDRVLVPLPRLVHGQVVQDAVQPCAK
jgi:hypothetical protein